MSIQQDIALIPRDGFFCKDGRGWHTSSTGRGHALDWPWPSTILGALRTASGRDLETPEHPFSPQDWEAHAGKVELSRLLALRRPIGEQWNVKHRVWPVPRDTLWIEGKEGGKRLIRLKPREHEARTLGRRVDDANDALREALRFPDVEDDAKPLSPPRWWGEEAFVDWLVVNDANVPAETPKWGETPIRRVQTRVAINAETSTAEDALLFSHDVMETLDRFNDHKVAHEWAIGAQVELPQKLGQKTARLGSDSRLAWIEEMKGDLFAAPKKLLDAFGGAGSKGLRLVVVTPAKFQNGWLPDGFAAHDKEFRGQLRGLSGDVALRAAFVQRPLHVSGWNMVAGGKDGHKGAPKETHRLVEPGAVYFFERKTPFTPDDAKALWLAALGARTKEGFGRVVPGVWDPNDIDCKEKS